MASVTTFQGVGEGQKLSSRVLAPPGGKCSDLFGSSEEPSAKVHQRSDPFRAEVNSPLRSRQEPDTKHRLGFNENQEVAEAPVAADAPVKESTEVQESTEEQEHNKENVQEEKEKVEEKSEELPKGRVPPGGFSTKLW